MNVNRNLISDGRDFIRGIWSTESRDPTEQFFSRIGPLALAALALPLIGTLAGLHLKDLVIVSLVPQPTLLAVCDAALDIAKLQAIDSRLEDLKAITLDKESPDYAKAAAAVELQEEAYKHIFNYTLTARNIKLFAALGLYAIALPAGTILEKGVAYPLGHMDLGLGIVGLAITGSALISGLYHWVATGNRLAGANLTLAKRAFKDLTSA